MMGGAGSCVSQPLHGWGHGEAQGGLQGVGHGELQGAFGHGGFAQGGFAQGGVVQLAWGVARTVALQSWIPVAKSAFSSSELSSSSRKAEP